MKICMIVANDMLRDSRVDRHSETLGMEGHDVTVLCVRTPRTPPQEKTTYYRIVRQRDLLRELFDRRMYVRTMLGERCNLASKSSRVSPFRNIVRTLSQISLVATFNVVMMLSAKRLNADVYVCNDLYTLPVGAFMKLLGKRIIYDSHELYPDLVGGTPHYLRRLMRSIESLLIRSADVVVTVNDFIATELSSRYNISYPIVIMNCPRTATSITTNRRKAERRKIVLYSGTFWQERGLENVVLACKYLRRDIQVVFRGEGAIESKLRDMSRDLENCVIEKPVPIGEVIRKAAEADVGIVPYLPTTLNNLYASPNKLFEYLQAGLPVIGSDLPFVRKVIVENDIGLVFDPFDPKDIARAMNHITQDKVLEAKKANVEKIRSRFSWEVESRKLLDAISSLSHRSTVIKQVDELGSLNR